MHHLALATFAAAVVSAFGAMSPAEDKSPAPAAKPARPVLDFAVTDLAGKKHDLRPNDPRRIRVFVFLSTECPIANGYTPMLNELSKKLAGEKERRVELFGVLTEADTTREKAATHFTEFRAAFPILFDDGRLVARALRPTHVPEVFVLDAQNGLVYRGALDNTWEGLGRRRPKPDRLYLLDALSAALDGKPAVPSATKPVGCLFELPLDK